MMDNAHAERLLIGIARQYTPALALVQWQRPGDYTRLTGKPLQHLARQLADRGWLVLFGHVPPSKAGLSDLLLRDWADGWLRLHTLFTDAFFPSFKAVDARLIETGLPRPLLLSANALPVTSALGMVAAPFIAAFHGKPRPEDPVLRRTIGAVLDHIEAGDSAPVLSERLQLQGSVLLRALLESPVATLTPVEYLPGETIPEPLPRIDQGDVVARSVDDTDSISMQVTVSDYTPLPPTLPELDSAGDSIETAPQQPLPPAPFISPAARHRAHPRPRPPVPNLPEKRD